MGLLDKFSKNKVSDSANANGNMTEMSYIAEMHHIEGTWNQYDFLLATRGYGWDYAIDSAEYAAKADLKNISTVSVSFLLGTEPVELVDEYKSSSESLKAMRPLSQEGANLGIGGISQVVGGPVKIVWFNQTRIISVFSPVNDEVLFTKYMETLIRRTFGTPDVMKLYAAPPKQ